MKKIVKFGAGFDRREEGYGMHGVEIRFVLKNYKGAVQFLIYTNWLPIKSESSDLKWYQEILPDAACNVEDKMFVALLINPFIPSVLRRPLPADLGYHSPKPTYEGQKSMTEECKFLDGKPCYYDGSGLNAIRMFKILLNEGDEGVWRELEEYHESVFGESILKKLRKKIDGAITAYLKFFRAIPIEDEETKKEDENK